jgi:hypothetical protein
MPRKRLRRNGKMPASKAWRTALALGQYLQGKTKPNG